MNSKKYIRSEPDGTHWPDADVGDQLLYGIDFTDYITESGEAITNVTWTVETGVTSVDNFEVGAIAYIKILTDEIGTFKVTCTLTTTLTAKTYIQVIPMLLTVY